MKILGIDPSFKQTGLSLISMEDPFLIFDTVSFDIAFEKDWISIFSRARQVKTGIDIFIENYLPDIVIMESPLPQSNFSGGASCLAAILMDFLLDKYGFIYTMNPSYLRYVQSKKKYTRTELYKFAQSVIEAEDYISPIKKFNGDEAVAFILAYRIAVRLGKTNRSGVKRFDDTKESFYRSGDESKWEKENHLKRMEKR
jgi:hypothetical protein